MKSGGATAAREVALAVVRDVFGPASRSAHASFDVHVRRSALDARDRAFAAELSYGSIKARRLLDWRLAPYVGTRQKPPAPTVVEILRLGAYQLHEMEGVAAHAAVSQSVDLAWRHGHKGTAGLVNAVLRRLASSEPRRPSRADFADDDEFLATAYSVPTWLARRYSRALDGLAEAALAGVNAAPRTALTVNVRKVSRDEARTLLAAAGVTTEPSSFVAETLLVRDGVVTDDPQGRWTLQSESAAMPVDLLEPQPGETVLELCSGRGNKTLQIAARLEERGHLFAVERNPKKVTAFERAAVRLGISSAAVVTGDALEALPDLHADAVLVDAPCSGLGIIGRQPEARWRKSPDDAQRFARVQMSLLHAAAARTKRSGRIVYSVCSPDPAEGAQVVTAFLAADPQWGRAPLPPRYAAFACGGDVSVPPGIEGRDGFYIATLVRTGGARSDESERA